MNDNLPPLPTPEAWRTHVGPWDCSTAYAYTVNQMREYAAAAVAAALSGRHALQGRGAHPAPCARQCEAQAFRSEIAAEQRRSEMYADLVRRTAEALGLTREDGWHKLPERVAVLCEANECFGKRQEWWTEKMFQLEQERDALRGENKALQDGIVRDFVDVGVKNAITELRAEVEALRADAERHYAAGWRTAAKWAERDDLISDIDSPAYIADRDAAIDNARSKE